MYKLSRKDLFSLEDYAKKRADYRRKVMAHKMRRKVALGPDATLYFEDRLTIQYQIQEMLRIEKIFEAEGIEEELHTYNPMIPNGSNWKATFMIEYADPEIRSARLQQLIGIENLIWVQIDDYSKVWAISNEDLERSNEEKTSSVHFMRFELSREMIDGLKSGAKLFMGTQHKAYSFNHEVGEETRNALICDLN